MFIMERKQALNVDVRQTVSVAQHEGLTVHVLTNALQATTGHRVQASVGQRHLKTLFSVKAVVAYARLVTKTDREIIVHRFIVQEIFLNHVSAIPEAKNKVA